MEVADDGRREFPRFLHKNVDIILEHRTIHMEAESGQGRYFLFFTSVISMWQKNHFIMTG